MFWFVQECTLLEFDDGGKCLDPLCFKGITCIKYQFVKNKKKVCCFVGFTMSPKKNLSKDKFRKARRFSTY